MTKDSDCVCAEINSRNCPVCQNAHEQTQYEIELKSALKHYRGLHGAAGYDDGFREGADWATERAEARYVKLLTQAKSLEFALEASIAYGNGLVLKYSLEQWNEFKETEGIE